MSRRITFKIRQTLTDAVITHRFKKDRAALLKREHALGLAIYLMSYSEDDRAALAKLPDGWAATRISMGAYIKNKGYECKLALPVPVPACDRFGTVTPWGTKAQRAVLEKRILAWYDDKLTLRSETSRLQAATEASLFGFKTIKQLSEAWPEMLPFIKANGFHEDEMKLPAVIPTNLNKELQLPV